MEKYRESTKRNYYRVWLIFNRFFIQLDIKPTEWDDCITLFTRYLIDQGKQSSTVKSYISAIKVVLLDNNIQN